MTIAAPIGATDELFGWKQIAACAEMAVSTARAKAEYGVEHRLPAYFDHARGLWVSRRSVIEQWKRDLTLPFRLTEARKIGRRHSPSLSGRASKKSRKSKANTRG